MRKGLLLGLGISLWLGMSAGVMAQPPGDINPPSVPTTGEERPRSGREGWFTTGQERSQRGWSDGGRRRQGAGSGQQGRRNKGKLRRMMARFDANHDGVLDAGEQASAVDAIMANPRVRQRLEKHPEKAEQVRQRLTQAAAKWHARKGQNGTARVAEAAEISRDSPERPVLRVAAGVTWAETPGEGPRGANPSLMQPLLTVLFFLLAATGPGAAEDERQRFNDLYAQLLSHRQQPRVMLSSRTSDYNNCEAFRLIVKGGESFLPFVVEKIEGGDFFLNQAMAEITKVEVRALYPESEGKGEQEVSRLWLRWWKER